MSEQSAPPQPPPQARLAQMATGFILSRLVYTAASLGIADHLASSPKSAGELAMTRVIPTTTSASIVEAQPAARRGRAQVVPAETRFLAFELGEGRSQCSERATLADIFRCACTHHDVRPRKSLNTVHSSPRNHTFSDIADRIRAIRCSSVGFDLRRSVIQRLSMHVHRRCTQTFLDHQPEDGFHSARASFPE